MSAADIAGALAAPATATVIAKKLAQIYAEETLREDVDVERAWILVPLPLRALFLERAKRIIAGLVQHFDPPAVPSDRIPHRRRARV